MGSVALLSAVLVSEIDEADWTVGLVLCQAGSEWWPGDLGNVNFPVKLTLCGD